MSKSYRLLWNKLREYSSKLNLIAVNSRTIPIVKRAAVTYTLGFSLFTWLGFDKKLTAEDSLIKSIKHCILFIQNGEYEKAEQLLHVSLRQAQQIQHQLGITYIYDLMANLALKREEFEKAKKLFVSVVQRILADGAKEDDLRVVHINTKLARICHLKKDYATAQLGYDWCIEKLENAVETENNSETQKLLAMTEDWYGRLFIDCNQNERGMSLLLSSLERMKQVPDVEQEHIAIQLNDIGTVCAQIGKPDEGIKYLQEAINLGKTLNMEELGAMHVNLGRAYLQKNLVNEARKSCGYGWRLGFQYKNNEIRQEADSCLKEIKNSHK